MKTVQDMKIESNKEIVSLKKSETNRTRNEKIRKSNEMLRGLKPHQQIRRCSTKNITTA